MYKDVKIPLFGLKSTNPHLPIIHLAIQSLPQFTGQSFENWRTAKDRVVSVESAGPLEGAGWVLPRLLFVGGVTPYYFAQSHLRLIVSKNCHAVNH